jgi:prevent-host-death family protein
MTLVASRELRNDTAGLVRRAEAGEQIIITVNGRAAAQLVALPEHRRRWLTRRELVRRLTGAQADPALRDDLERLAGDSTDDLGPIR